jgi:predicted RNase H-like HicB family nuclease
MQTSEETLKNLSEAIDAFASAKVANNESLIRFSIANLQQFINEHDITPKSEPSGDEGE